jgi:hypothetical protein
MSSAETVVQGVGKVIPKVIALADGITPSTAYQLTDTLSCRVWVGDQEAAIVAPAVAWDATNGPPYYQITLQYSDTQTVPVGLYSMQVIATRPGTSATAIVYDGQLEVLPAPGTGTAPHVYIQYQDLLPFAPAIASYQQHYRDTTGFAFQRAVARDWLDELCHRNLRGMAGLSSLVYPAEWPYRFQIKSPLLQSYLDNNYLWLSRPLMDCQINYTLHLIYRGLIPTNPELFREESRKCKVDAELALRGATGQIMGPKADGTGTATGNGTLLAMVDFSSSKMLRA